MDNFISTLELRKILRVGKSKLYDLRVEQKLIEGIHFCRLPGGRKLLWNLPLVKDFFVTGGSYGHQRAIDAYLSELPSNKPRKSGRKKKSA